VVPEGKKVVAFCRVSTYVLVNGSASTRAEGVVAPFQKYLENERGL